ncbi:hypothetical protein Metal_2892 [Methylomicrobium album BG8]|uniref:Uncharacterized protein n=2 Tax=Methylococcaceae TaxID=403 RepID=H8GLQ1_METAL|nr:hypothetical protein Metal_2892 [Methylomicrobium album BG8]
MINPPKNEKVACCTPIAVQRATFDDSGATNSATANATNSLKALAGAVLERNAQRNATATVAEKQCNFCNEKTGEKLRSFSPELRPEIGELHHCRERRHLSSSGYCIQQRFRPVDDIPRRCEDFSGYPASMSARVAAPGGQPIERNASTKPHTGLSVERSTSEAAHNAHGRFFKFLATRPDGRQCYLCQMPRQTLEEMQTQYPDATHIQPVEGEDYPHD